MVIFIPWDRIHKRSPTKQTKVEAICTCNHRNKGSPQATFPQEIAGSLIKGLWQPPGKALFLGHWVPGALRLPWWTTKFFGLWPPLWKRVREWKSTKTAGISLKPEISHVHEVGPWIWNPQMTKLSSDDSHKNDPKLYRSLGDDPTVTNQQKSPTVTRHQPLKMSQQTHGIPKKERLRMTKRRMLRSSPKAWAERNKPFFQWFRCIGIIDLLGGGNSNIYFFKIFSRKVWGFHDPIWLAHIFQMGWVETTNQ